MGHTKCTINTDQTIIQILNDYVLRYINQSYNDVEQQTYSWILILLGSFPTFVFVISKFSKTSANNTLACTMSGAEQHSVSNN